MDKPGYIIEHCNPNCSRAAVSSEALEELLRSCLDSMEFTKQLNQKFIPISSFNIPKLVLSGCPNGCSQPLIKDFGIIGFVTPTLTVKPCTECEACINGCSEKALALRDGSINIDNSLCISCGDCFDRCSSGTLVAEKRGWKLYIGGRVGRHPHFAELFGSTKENTEIVGWISEILKDYIDFCPSKKRLSHYLEAYYQIERNNEHHEIY